jgi:hypothetical protein
MSVRSDLRKEAYSYILRILNGLSVNADEKRGEAPLSLDELRLIKEGTADPSAALVALIKSLLCGTVSEAEIEAHLVTPFKLSQE